MESNLTVLQRLAQLLPARMKVEVSGPAEARQLLFVASVSMAFATFCLIGFVNTLIHASMLVLLSEGASWMCHFDAAAREDWHKWFNGAGFLVANLFSYFANSRWSFNARAGVGSYLKFAMTSLVGFWLSVGIMHVGVEILHWYYLVVFVPQTVLMCVVNFTLLRLLVFKVGEPAVSADASREPPAE